MINKENDDKKQEPKDNKDDKFIDLARMDVQAHIMIKDKETGKVLLNKRG